VHHPKEANSITYMEHDFTMNTGIGHIFFIARNKQQLCSPQHSRGQIRDTESHHSLK
jgi:hypothetical protein